MKHQHHSSRTLILLTAITYCALAYARHDGAYLREVTTALKTPHFEWAKPYAGGKPKVLFVIPRTMAPREVVELWQRFDLDYTAFTSAHSGLMSFESDSGAAPYDLAVEGTSIEEKAGELVGKLARKYDAIVLANANLDALPKEAQYRILRQVADGAGLLFTFGRTTSLPLFKKPLAEDRAPITQGVPLSGIGYFAREDIRKALAVQQESDFPGKLVETFAFGRGRIAVLNYGQGSSTYYGGQGLTPAETYSLNWQTDYEYLLSLVYKTLLWTMAEHKPTVFFTDLPAEAQTYARDALPTKLGVRLQCDRSTGLIGKLEILVRDHTDVVESRKETPLKLAAGEGTLSVDLPRVKAGEHFVDLIVRSQAATEQWGSVFFRVTNPLTLAAFGTVREFAEKGEPVALTAALSAPAPAKTHLVVTLTDSNDRCYARRDLAIAPDATAGKPLTLDLSGSTTIATRVHGELRVGDEVLDAHDSFVFVPRRQSNLFRSVIWGLGGDSGLTHLGLRQLRAAGFTDHLSHPTASGSTERLMALCDLPLVCYAYRIGGDVDEKGWRHDMWIKDVADGCFHNPELQQKAAAAVTDRIKNVIAYGPSLYSLGDENYFGHKSGFSPIGVQSFRERLRKQYGDIKALNDLWGSQYTSFDDIQLVPSDDALKQRLWPLVHEHMAFNEQEYADYHHFLRDVIKQQDAHAWVGAEGSVPGDLEQTIAGLEIWGPYADKRGNELLRSLCTPQLVRGNWWGGYVGSHGARAGAGILWRQLLSGSVNTSLFFAATGSEGLFATELSYADYFRKTLPDLREIYGGIGQLLAASQVADDGLAVHWSQASEHAATMFATVGSPVSSQGNLLGLLDRNGFGYRYVTTSTVEGGALEKDRYRALFLACSQALSEAEVKQITSFVDGGGILIADVGTGSMNGVCRPLWKSASGDPREWHGQLDDVLGIRREGAPSAKSQTTNLSFPLGKAKLTLNEFPFRTDASVVADSQVKVDGVPVFLTRSQGKGKVIFLNFPFPNPEHPDGARFLRDLLGAVDFHPESWLTDSRGYLCRRFVNDGLTLIGVAREAETARDTALKLAASAYVYDTRAGKLLGKLDSVSLPRGTPDNRVFALLPQPASPPTIACPKSVARGQRTTIQLGLPKAGAPPAGRILRLQVLRPDGTEATPCRQYVVLDKPTATADLTWAFNDLPGAWTVKVTDVATGLSVSAKVTVH